MYIYIHPTCAPRKNSRVKYPSKVNVGEVTRNRHTTKSQRIRINFICNVYILTCNQPACDATKRQSGLHQQRIWKQGHSFIVQVSVYVRYFATKFRR